LNKFYILFYLCDANFQHHDSSVSHDPFEIILICWFDQE